jgi:hypothetical protein
MRLPKHSLPKEASKHHAQFKHKKAQLKIQRRLEKKINNEMIEDSTNLSSAFDVNSDSNNHLIIERKIEVKLKRKQANRQNVLYKKINKSISGKNGPRAVTK